MEKEIWKQVTGFENYYISNLGNVKSIKKGSSKILKLGSATNGYKQTTIKTQRKPTYFSRWMNLVNNFV